LSEAASRCSGCCWELTLQSLCSVGLSAAFQAAPKRGTPAWPVSYAGPAVCALCVRPRGFRPRLPMCSPLSVADAACLSGAAWRFLKRPPYDLRRGSVGVLKRSLVACVLRWPRLRQRMRRAGGGGFGGPSLTAKQLPGPLVCPPQLGSLRKHSYAFSVILGQAMSILVPGKISSATGRFRKIFGPGLLVF